MKTALLFVLSLALLGLSCQKPYIKENLGSEPFAEFIEGQGTAHAFKLPALGEASGYFSAESASWRAPFIPIASLGGLPAWASPDAPEWLVGGRMVTLGSTGGGQPYSVLPGNDGFPPVGASAPTVLARANIPGTGHRVEARTDGSIVLIGSGDPAIAQAVFKPNEPLVLAVAGGVCLVARGDGTVVALSIPDLVEQWRTEGQKGPMLAVGDAAFWTDASGAVRVIALDTGETLALFNQPGLSFLALPAWDGSVLYLAMEDGSIMALAPGFGGALWRSSPGFSCDFIVAGGNSIYAFGEGSARALSRNDGSDMGTVALPDRAAVRPIIWNGLLVYASVGGLVYANVPASDLPAKIEWNETSLARGIAFKLEKYLVQPGVSVMAEGFLPYADYAPHDGTLPFTAFAWDVSGDSADMVFEAREGNGSLVPEDAIIVLFDDRGNELRSNIDEFGAHPSFSQWIDSGKRYYVALGRRDAPRPPLFLRIRKR